MSSVYPSSGRVESTSVSHLVKTGKQPKSANDSIDQLKSSKKGQSIRRTYVTRTRVEALNGQLVEHQKATMADVGRVGVLTGRQVQRLHYGPSTAGGRLARKHLSELVRSQVLTRLDRSIGGERAGSTGYVYALGPAGQRLLHPERWRFRPAWTPRPSYLRHALAVSELYVSLRERERSSDIELLAFDSEPRCWRRYFGPGGARSFLKPDALAIVGLDEYEDRYFIEADCGTEPGTRILSKAKTYVRYWQSGREQADVGIFPFVLWIAPDERRAEFLVDAMSKLDAEHWRLFMVSTAEEAPQKIATGTGLPISNQKEVT